jgi:hypothetical protein
MIVWVREDKAFYYLRDNPDSPSNPGITFSDWILFSGGGGATTSCTKSGYISGESFFFTNQVSTASVVFNTPYTYASYSVAITGWSTNLNDPEQYLYTIYDIQPTGFLIQILSETPIGATAMWITNCWEGSNDIGGGGGGPAASVEIDLEEIAFGTGTGITSSNLFTYDPELQNLKSGYHKFLSDPRNSVIIGGTGSEIKYDINNVIIGGHVNCIYNSTSNVIIGGIGNCSNYVSYGSIISSKDSNIYQSSNFSSIINSRKGCIASYGQNLNYNTIIGSSGSCVISSRSSSVINSRNSEFTGGGCYSSIIGSDRSCISDSLRSQIISGNLNKIYNTEDVILIGSRATCVKGCNELITDINGTSNCFYGVTGNRTNAISLNSGLIMMTGSSRVASIVSCDSDFFGSCTSLIVSSCKSILCQSSRSSIISSCSVGICLNTFDSTIMSSLNSKIENGRRSSIIAGRENCITGVSGFSLVLFGGGNQIHAENYNSGILGGCLNTMTFSVIGQGNFNSLIIGGCTNTLMSSTNSIILGGSSLTMSSVSDFVYVPSIRGFGSVQFDLKTASTNYILTQENFTLLTYPPISGMTVSLPVAADSTHRLYVIKKDSSSTQSIVYISPNTGAGDTIEGYSGSIELINPWDYNILQSDGVNLWIKLGGAVGLNL